MSTTRPAITIHRTIETSVDVAVRITRRELLEMLDDKQLIEECRARGIGPDALAVYPADPCRDHIEDLVTAHRQRDDLHFGVVVERLCREIGVVMP